MRKPPTLDDLRRYGVARSIFNPASLPQALTRLGFVQADPIRAPARAQDLMLRHRVRGYVAGDLERRYASLDIEEDFFVNYGFLTSELHRLLHPRTAQTAWPASRWKQAHAVLDFVRAQGTVHPREVDAQFQHGKSRNWFGGSSRASTQLLDGMHYRGMLRVARREGGVRLYAARDLHAPAEDPNAAMDRLVDVILNIYAPLPLPSLSGLISHLRAAAPQWTALRREALARARQRLPHARVDGVDWFWPEGDNPVSRRHAEREVLRLLAPFDPVVWDRRRFELFWGWAYRFEAYTPAPQRVRGYYALPMLWRDRVIGWANVAWRNDSMNVEVGYVAGKPPTDRGFRPAWDEELQRMHNFLLGRSG